MSDLILRASRGADGLAIVEAVRDGRTVVCDRVDLASSADRLRFANDLAQRVPGLAADVIESELLVIDRDRLPVMGPDTDWPDPVPIDRPDLPAFPVEALPGPLRAWVDATAEAAQVPADLPALLGLAVCAGAVARRVEIEPWRGYREPLNLYAVCLQDPASRKSAVFREALAPLRTVEAELIEAARPEVARAQSDRRMREIELGKLEQSAAKGDHDAREKALRLAEELAQQPVPVLPKLLVDDAIAEAVEMLLAAQGGRLVVAGAEGGVFDVMAGRYSSGMANIDCFLKGHSGDDLRVDRISRGSVVVDRCCLTLAYAIQPEVIRGMAAQRAFRGRGLIGRFIYGMPASRLGSRRINSDPVPPFVSASYQAAVRRLCDITPADGGPAVLRLSPGAADCFRDWAVEVEAMLGPDGRLSSMRDWGGKLVGLTARLAGLIHLVSSGDRDAIAMPVGVDAIEAAIRIGRWAIPHAEGAIALMVADDGSSDDAAYVLRWLKQRAEPEVSRRDIHQHGRARFDRDAARLDRALVVLVDRGWLRAVDGGRVGPGRPGSDRYRCHPQIVSGPQDLIPDCGSIAEPEALARVEGVI
jgi:hypothetical protein